ncbi:MAG: response regulator transcription factor [Bryobacterales bacterium]
MSASMCVFCWSRNSQWWAQWLTDRLLVATALELKPRVVVTDFMMEPTNGIEAAAAILAHCVPKPAIVMLTAVSDPETARAAFAAGILGFVSKMHLSEDLIPAIEAALAGLRFLSQLPPAAKRHSPPIFCRSPKIPEDIPPDRRIIVGSGTAEVLEALWPMAESDRRT